MAQTAAQAADAVAEENAQVAREMLHDFPPDVLRKLGRAWRHLQAERATGAQIAQWSGNKFNIDADALAPGTVTLTWTVKASRRRPTP
jgi:hypothetical protein